MKPSLSEIHNLPDDKVLILGNLKHSIVSLWTKDIKRNLSVILTGKQRNHYLKKHNEMQQYEDLLFDCVLNPDEVHRNKRGAMIALFYIRYDADHFLRTDVLMQPISGKKKHSVLSYRIAGTSEIEIGRIKGRCVWKK
jgi:hypothetical protein